VGSNPTPAAYPSQKQPISSAFMVGERGTAGEVEWIRSQHHRVVLEHHLLVPFQLDPRRNTDFRRPQAREGVVLA
jgi:hypothetical protein